MKDYNLWSPSLFYSLTHVHRSIGYHNRNPQSLVESATSAHRSIGYHNRNPQSLSESVTRLMYPRE